MAIPPLIPAASLGEPGARRHTAEDILVSPQDGRGNDGGSRPQGRPSGPASPQSPDPGPTVRPACATPQPPRPGCARPARSEEHTSELQSLMRSSYAVFCLKNKTHTIYNC